MSITVFSVLGSRVRAVRLRAFATVLLAATAHASAFDGIRITLLGTGSTVVASDRQGPSLLVEAGEEVLLFDCGRGTVGRLRDAGVPLRDLTNVFLTNLDLEHTSGCGEVWATRHRSREVAPLTVWGPGGTMARVKEWDREGGPPEGNEESRTEAFEITENTVYQTDDLTITAIVADYPPTPESYGYRVDYRGRAIALSGATRYSLNLIRSAHNVQVLVHEVAAVEVQRAAADPSLSQFALAHSSPEEVGRALRAARPYLAVLSNVMLVGTTEADVMRRVRAQYRGPVEMGRDLMIIEVQGEVQVRGVPSDGRRDER